MGRLRPRTAAPDATTSCGYIAGVATGRRASHCRTTGSGVGRVPDAWWCYSARAAERWVRQAEYLRPRAPIGQPKRRDRRSLGREGRCGVRMTAGRDPEGTIMRSPAHGHAGRDRCAPLGYRTSSRKRPAARRSTPKKVGNDKSFRMLNRVGPYQCHNRGGIYRRRPLRRRVSIERSRWVRHSRSGAVPRMEDLTSRLRHEATSRCSRRVTAFRRSPFTLHSSRDT